MHMIIDVVGIKVRLASNTEDIFTFLRGFDHILDLYYHEITDNGIYDCTLTYFNEDIENGKIFLCGDDVLFVAAWRSVYRSTSIRTLLILIAERYRQQHRRQITFHASAVSNGKYGYVFMGGQGAGKTTLAMEMVLNQKCKFFANEYAVIGDKKSEMYLFGGIGPLSLRYESLSLSFPELANKLFEKVPDDTWNRKIRVNPSSLGMKTENECVILDKIFIVSLNKSGKNYVNKMDDPYKINALLYEEASRIIKGCALPIYTPDGLVETFCPSFDTELANTQRQTLFEKMKNRMFMITGTLNYCTEQIQKLMK